MATNVHSSPSRHFNEPRPFGERSAEKEKQVLGKSYREYFFEHAPFVRESLNPSTYLVVGRRGAGKSSLAEYFTFQRVFPKACVASISSPKLYAPVIEDITKNLHYPPEVSIPMMSDVWKWTIWSLVFSKLADQDPAIKAAVRLDFSDSSPSAFVSAFLQGILEKYLVSRAGDLTQIMADYARSKLFADARLAAMNFAKKNGIIISIDSMEHYSIDDEGMLTAAAALIQAASEMNTKYALDGLHIKVFMTDEVFPRLVEGVISNPSKYVTDELYLHWKPRDLVRLVCWRFHRHLQAMGRSPASFSGIDWNSFSSVEKAIWHPYFGKEVKNRSRITERTFPYVLRHTQLRPRQMVTVCNTIARHAGERFPDIDSGSLVAAAREAELGLANEVINSYSRIYTNVGDIVAALAGMEMTFPGKALDKVARRSAASWPPGSYSLPSFRRMVAELGIVGRQRKAPDPGTGIIPADFEFALVDRLFVNEDDKCVIHPMFYRKLNIRLRDGMSVYPFPDHPDYDDVQYLKRIA